MSDQLLKRWPTGRPWGQKVEPKLLRKEDGLQVYEMDDWEGPSVAGEEGQYFRGRWKGKMP